MPQGLRKQDRYEKKAWGQGAHSLRTENLNFPSSTIFLYRTSKHKVQYGKYEQTVAYMC